MPDEIQLPDGRTLVIPDNTTLDQRAALRNKLGAQYADPKTGAGMEQRALQQSHRGFTGTGDQGNYDATGRKVSGPQGEPLTLMERAAQGQADRQSKLGAAMNRAGRSPMPFTAATSAYAPVPAALSIAGSEVGGRAGKALGGDYGELAGRVVGGVTGGTVGGLAEGGGGRLVQRITRGPGASGEAEIPFSPSSIKRELEAKIPRNEPPAARGEMQTEVGQQSADAISRESRLKSIADRGAALKERTTQRQLAEQGKAIQGTVDARQKWLADRGKLEMQDATEQAAAINRAQPDAPTLAGRTGGAAEPFEPLVYSSPQEAAQLDFRAKNLERQASRAGMFSAAQGKVGRPLNYQQRIGGAVGTSAPEAPILQKGPFGEAFGPSGPPPPQGDMPQGNPTPFAGPERRTGSAYDREIFQKMLTNPEGQQLEQSMRQARSGAPSGIGEGEARNYLMKQPGMWEKFKTADEAGRRQMLIQARDALKGQP